MIGAWEELKELKERDIKEARDRLIELLADYRAYVGIKTIVVFDAHYVPGIEMREKAYNLEIIYTKENETADECIERLVPLLKNIHTQIYVATSDFTEQRIVFGKGALRKSARDLYADVKEAKQEITRDLKRRQQMKPQAKIPIKKEVLDIFEKWRRGHI